MSIFLAILEYIGILSIFYGSLGLVQGFIEYYKRDEYDNGFPIIAISIGIALVYFC